MLFSNSQGENHFVEQRFPTLVPGMPPCVLMKSARCCNTPDSDKGNVAAAG